MRVISFKVWGDFAHFRRQYTTSSPLTYSIMPPSAARGLIGAIMGFKSEQFPKILSPDKAKIGIRLLNPVKKIRIGINYMDTKGGSWAKLDKFTFRLVVEKDGHGNPRLHTQVRIEFLKDPAFEIFFHHIDKNIMDEFSKRLKEHRTVYTPYLGITECIGNFTFLWDRDVEHFDGRADIISAFTDESINKIVIKDEIKLVKEKIPVFLNDERINVKSENVVFNPYADPTPAYVKEAFLYPEGSNRVFAFIG